MNMKKNHKIKLIAIFLILSITITLCLLLTSCGGDNKTDETNNNNNQNQNAADDDRSANSDGPSLEELYPYPDHDFKGETIKFLSRKDDWANGSQDFDDLNVEAETGEVLNDSVYKRTKTIEEKYSVLIEAEHVKDPTATITKSIKAGDDEYQMIQEKLMFMSATLAPQNFLYNLKAVSSINLDAPWYDQNAIKDLSINNKITVLSGDMTVSDKSGVIFAVFNKKMMMDYGFENLYNTVSEGKWTLDKLYELMTAVSADLNGDGKMTLQDDQWGLIIENYGGWMFSVASGNRIAGLDENGLPYITCTGEKNINDYERIKKIMYEQNGRSSVNNPEEHANTFAENRALFSITGSSSIAALRSMEEDFGIVPLPKQDETQKDYYTPLSAWISRSIAMPTTCGNPEMVGAVIDAMSRESTETVVPAYFNNLMNQKIARDEESIDMLKMIFGSIIYDLGAVFNWGGIWDEQQNFIGSKKDDYLGNYERIQGKVEAALQKTIDSMLENN